MKKAVKIYVRGIVQGVFFRAFVKKEADKLGLRGYVRNLEDGGVEVFVEGDVEKLKELIDKCRKGPVGSQIKNVDIKEEKIQNMKEFKILHI